MYKSANAMQANRIRAAESADRVSGGSWCTRPSDVDATIEVSVRLPAINTGPAVIRAQ